MKYTTMTPDEVIITDHPHLIELATDGCVQAATVLMSDAAICIQHGIPLPEPLASYIGKALYDSALHPETIADDFNLKRGRGKNKYDADFHNHLVCLEAQFHKLSGYSYTQAYNAIADEYRYDDVDSVKNLFTKHHRRWQVKDKSIDDLRDMLVTYRRLFKKKA
jgi:hypothetical protein